MRTKNEEKDEKRQKENYNLKRYIIKRKRKLWWQITKYIERKGDEEREYEDGKVYDQEKRASVEEKYIRICFENSEELRKRKKSKKRKKRKMGKRCKWNENKIGKREWEDDNIVSHCKNFLLVMFDVLSLFLLKIQMRVWVENEIDR